MAKWRLRNTHQFIIGLTVTLTLLKMKKKNVAFKCKLCKPNLSKKNTVYSTKQKLGKNGNLLKHLRSHEELIRPWLKAFVKYQNKPSSDKKLDLKMLHLFKFFINNEIAVRVLNDKDLKHLIPEKISKYLFKKEILPKLMQCMNAEITHKLQNSSYVVLLVDAWTSKKKKEFSCRQ